METSGWSIAAASVRGKSHEQSGIPCQDACVVQASEDGKWVALVASDGAGTAAHSDVSSKLVSLKFACALIDLAAELDGQPPGAWVTDAVIEHIVSLRKQLRVIAGSDDISAYHCTLVAALVGPSGGFTIHLGDGAVFAGAADLSGATAIDLSRDYFVSLPQNGEYANETVFMTERDWIKHLRIQPVSSVDWLVLGTDGGMALAMVAEKMPKTGFVIPILQSLLSNPGRSSRDAALHAILSDRQADRLTNDDKTLIAVVRSTCTAVQGEFQDNKPVPSNAFAPPPNSTGSPALAHFQSAAKDLKIHAAPRQVPRVLPNQGKRKRVLRSVAIALVSLPMLAVVGSWYLFTKSKMSPVPITPAPVVSQPAQKPVDIPPVPAEKSEK